MKSQADDALAAFGLVRSEDQSDIVEETFALWPENQLTFEFWQRLRTQWIVDMHGRHSMNYLAVEAVMNMMGIEQTSRPLLFDEVRAMEIAEINVRMERR